MIFARIFISLSLFLSALGMQSILQTSDPSPGRRHLLAGQRPLPATLALQLQILLLSVQPGVQPGTLQLPPRTAAGDASRAGSSPSQPGGLHRHPQQPAGQPRPSEVVLLAAYLPLHPGLSQCSVCRQCCDRLVPVGNERCAERKRRSQRCWQYRWGW